MDLGLNKKTVIVTGGGSNIGRSISLEFAAEKANVVIADRDEEQAKIVAAEVDNIGGHGFAVKTDITDLDSIDNLYKLTLEKFQSIDVLINNVGIWEDPAPYVQSSPGSWDKLTRTNVRGIFGTVRAILPIMIKQNHGAIVNIGSDAGRVGQKFAAVYSANKGAIIAFSKVIALEGGRNNIRCNVVCPGLAYPKDINMFGEGSAWKRQGIPTEELVKKMKNFYPLSRIGAPEEVASAVVYLASEKASFITGQTLSVSGGYTMC